eukprot:CAMPEP_0172619380 /NCGR_PEP_ID=MMETSP1068-20121228/92805_1 /TAXON_ID=35684 /ORGANISM="Pseudopedinella elastica, Strain CCMP716" /LENGTH=54 /DNA_ID=CAMNT_0013426111 /DNA_START=8 /DNA_END=172 /DNA_ORIENTATION=+
MTRDQGGYGQDWRSCTVDVEEEGSHKKPMEQGQAAWYGEREASRCTGYSPGEGG